MVIETTTKKPLGCLLGIIGSSIGIWLGHLSFELYAQSVLADDPHRFICGNDALPGMLLGMMIGGLAGIRLGRVVAYFRGRSKRFEETDAKSTE